MPKVHDLKTWPDSFQAVLDGTKTHELRPSDRDYEVGDVLHLQEFVPCERCHGTRREWDNGDMTDCGACWVHEPGGGYATGGKYTGRDTWVAVTFLTPPGKFGLDSRHCVMSIRQHVAG